MRDGRVGAAGEQRPVGLDERVAAAEAHDAQGALSHRRECRPGRGVVRREQHTRRSISAGAE